MQSLLLLTSDEVATELANRIRQERVRRGWTQEALAQRAGVSLATYRLFEATGRISLERLLRIVSAMGRLAEWNELFRPTPVISLEDLAAPAPKRRRGQYQQRTARSSTASPEATQVPSRPHTTGTPASSASAPLNHPHDSLEASSTADGADAPSVAPKRTQ